MARSTACADTGNLATITFASGITATYKCRFIDPSEESIGMLDCSHLGTTGYRTLMAEDLADPTELSIEWLWDTFDEPPVLGTALGNVTVTYPLRSGESTAATRVAKGVVMAVKHPRLENNVLQVGSLKVKYTEAPVYTEST